MNNSQHSLGESGQFNDSFVMQPINLNSYQSKLNDHKVNQRSHISSNNYGEYQQYKLSQLLTGTQEIFQSSAMPKIMSMVTIDPESEVISQNQEFNQILKRYSAYDVVFVGVTGKKDVGKSFFCDKVLNLAQVKGNHYSRSHNPGLNVWSNPFFKNNMCIFLVEVSGCQFQSKSYNSLMTILLMISSLIVFVNKNDQKNKIEDFEKNVIHLTDSIDFGGEKKERMNKFMPKALFNLVRQNPDQMQMSQLQPKSSDYFSDIHNKALPNAMASSYKGKNQDLVSYSFLAKQCINEGYIKQVSRIFKSMYDHLEEKNYNDLYINGNIASKILQILVMTINSRKTIKIQRIYQEITRDLYISAYNFCVISYQKELEQYFKDEKAKDVDQIFQIFESASTGTLNKFLQFNLSKELFHQYENKLINHINQKQILLLQINKQKTIDQLEQRFKNFEGKEMIEMFKKEKKELNHGRSNFICHKVKSSKSSSNIDMKSISALQNINQKLVNKRKEYEQIRNKHQEKKKNDDLKRQELKYESENLDKEIKRLSEEIATRQKRNKSIREGAGIKQLQEQKIQQTEKFSKKKQMLTRLKGENLDQVLKQLQGQNKLKIQKIVKQQNKVKQEIAALKNPEAVIKKPNEMVNNRQNSPDKNKNK